MAELTAAKSSDEEILDKLIKFNVIPFNIFLKSCVA